jgi:hypothetical protein
MIPFGIHKGKHFLEVKPSYLLMIFGYIKNNKCVLPNDKPRFAFRYPDFYNEILNSIETCLRCGNNIDKNSEDKNKRILCCDCYEKHQNNILYRKTQLEKDNDLNHITEEHIILDQLIKKYNLVKLDKFVSKTNWWKQEKPCAICNKEYYGGSSYSTIIKTNYNLCSECYTDKGYINNYDNFNIDIYNNYLNTLKDRLNMIHIDNYESAIVTKKLTELCVDIAKELNCIYIPEKPANKTIYSDNMVFYDLEIINGSTKFIIEIDRTHNVNTVMKINDALYTKCIWLRWGKIDNELDKSNNKCDILVLPLKIINKKWYNLFNHQTTSSKITSSKKNTLLKYNIVKSNNNDFLNDPFD